MPKPDCKALLLAQDVIIDRDSGKCSIINIFDVFKQKTFPGPVGPFRVFLRLTGAAGKCRLRIEIQTLADMSVLAHCELNEVEFASKTISKNITTPPLTFPVPEPGVYDLLVLADGEELDRLKITVQQRE